MYFDINILEDTKKAVACVDKNIFKNYKNVPSNLKSLLNDEVENKETKINYLAFEERLSKLNSY